MTLPGGAPLRFDDETLRDGLQSPSVRAPELDAKVEFLRLAAEVGVTDVDLGLPGAGDRALADVVALARALSHDHLPLHTNCAARTADADLDAVSEVIQQLGAPIEVMLFLACSPIRCEIQGWTQAELIERTRRAVGRAVCSGAEVTFVAEDATRARPEVLDALFLAAVAAGAARVCVADTAGAATPDGAGAVIRAVRTMLDDGGGAAIGIDWHGHDDRGLAVANALAAAAAGADRVHGTALGIGERAGNAAMELLLVNSRMLGWARPDCSCLTAYAAHAAGMFGLAVPPGSPVVGRDAFRTSTGVHASAILKARSRNETALADLVYSAVPASWFGRGQEIDIGPMSGSANVRAWLGERGRAVEPDVASRMLAAAKDADRILTDEELEELADSPARPGTGE